MIHKSHFSYVVWALTPWAGDPSPRCRFQRQVEDWALHSKREVGEMAVSDPSPLLGLWGHFSSYSGSWVFFQDLFFFFLFPSLPPPVCASCLSYLPQNRKRRGRRRRRRMSSSSQNSSWVCSNGAGSTQLLLTSAICAMHSWKSGLFGAEDIYAS